MTGILQFVHLARWHVHSKKYAYQRSRACFLGYTPYRQGKAPSSRFVCRSGLTDLLPGTSAPHSTPNRQCRGGIGASYQLSLWVVYVTCPLGSSSYLQDIISVFDSQDEGVSVRPAFYGHDRLCPNPEITAVGTLVLNDFLPIWTWSAPRTVSPTTQRSHRLPVGSPP